MSSTPWQKEEPVDEPPQPGRSSRERSRLADNTELDYTMPGDALFESSEPAWPRLWLSMSLATTPTRSEKPRFAIARAAIRSTGAFSSTVAVSMGNCAASEQA